MFIYTLLSMLFCRIISTQCENYTISLLYPFTDHFSLGFIHYASSFVMAVEYANNHSYENNNNITLLYTIDDTNNNGPPNRPRSVRELESLRIITRRSLENYDAFVGPGLKTCGYQGRLAVAYNKPLIGYICNEASLSDKQIFPTFARTASPDSYVYLPLIAVLEKYNWKRLAVISGNEDSSPRTNVTRKKLVSDLKRRGYTVSFNEPFSKNVSTNNNDNFFRRLKQSARIVVFLNDNFAENYFVFEAYVHNMSNGDYVFLLVDTTSIVTFDPNSTVQVDDNIPAYWGNIVNQILTHYRLTPTWKLVGVIETIKRSFWIASWVTDQKRYHLFEREVSERKKELFNCTDGILSPCVGSHLPNEAAYLYNAVVVYYKSLLETKLKNENTRDGKVVMNNAKGISFQSVTGFDVQINDQLDAMFNMTMLSLQEVETPLSPAGKIMEWMPFGSFMSTPTKDDKYAHVLKTTAKVTNWDNFPPPDTPKCGFQGELCIKPTPKPDTQNYEAAIIAGCIIGLLLVGAMYGGIYIYRQRLILANMSWKIDGNEIMMAPSAINSSRLSINTIVKNEEDDGFGTQIFTKIAYYKSQLVSVKTLTNVRIVLTRTVLTELRDMLDLSHENVNPFLGMALQSNQCLVIFQYCPKGSLQDVLANDDIKLDNMFLTSFVRDIVKGMQYLHSSPLKSFGRLKSSNCIVDSRWLIKITDFGTSFLRTGLNPLQECDVNSFYSSLLWTAPELLRMNNPPSIGTQKGDVYSFGIILQEIITRSEPYSMHELEAVDIIQTLKERSNPPFRPSVQQYRSRLSSVGEKNDDRELYNLMVMCYAEEPTVRPSFNEIKKFIKKISTGKETNVFEHMVKMLEKYSNNLENVVEERTKLLIEEKKKTDDLIYRLLPSFVAEQLKQNNAVEAERYDESTIYFSDIVGFTTISGMSTPMQVVDLLNDLYTLFDAIIKNYDVYKVETIGDAYMVVSGVPIRNGHMHAVEIADLSLHLLKAVDEQFIIRHMPKAKLQIRIGVHSGPVAAGVVGTAMPRYCLFGDTVNKASRMESNGEELRIHISAETKGFLDTHGHYNIVPREGKVHLKNVGLVQTYWLLEKRSISQFIGKKTAKVSPLAPLMRHGSPLLDKAPSKLNVLRRVGEK
ncbi:atrial natriuretic peptide receptor 1-like isoform X2 [Hydractinia symbiolongicarpus]|uniref:atrial natriuretic peptide receptor 1-like isoform X2 n=1 Tax=Hydractinia symbiolongicarpus TaxID=13093 RepID=UPI00254BF868|nr:atrial natriuretic peptide receptor 1-like isoform X2 [Hydractinia symbiolongicarpus]